MKKCGISIFLMAFCLLVFGTGQVSAAEKEGVRTKSVEAGRALISAEKLAGMSDEDIANYLKTLSPEDLANVVAMVTADAEADMATRVIDCAEVAVNSMDAQIRGNYVEALKDVITVDVKVDTQGVVSIVPVERAGSEKKVESVADAKKEEEDDEKRKQEEEKEQEGEDGGSSEAMVTDSGAIAESEAVVAIDLTGEDMISITSDPTPPAPLPIPTPPEPVPPVSSLEKK